MASNVQKTPIARGLEQFANRKVASAINLLQQALPASIVKRTGGIVTVKFELTNIPFTLPQITCPLIGAEFIRLPLAAGTLGWVMTADAYLGGVSGLGGGTADLTQRPNLSNLVFSPIGNKNWTASEKDTATVIYGPDGVIIRDTAKTKIVDLTDSNGIKITFPGGKFLTIEGNVIINGNLQLSGNIENVTGGTYAGNLQTSGGIIAGFGTGNQVGLQTHTHTQTPDSHGDSEQPTQSPTSGT